MFITQMYAPVLFPSHLLPSIITITLILIAVPTSYSNGNEQYSACRRRYKCGNTQNIKYPFWGDSRPQFCGLDGFNLTCRNNDHFTLDMGTQRFRVLRNNEGVRALVIARIDLWNDICAVEFNDTTLNVTLFDYSPNVEFLNLLYDCPSEANTTTASIDSSRNSFKCMINGTQRNGYLEDQSFSSAQLPELQSCKINMTVPVLRLALQDFRNDSSMTLQTLLNQGFQVEYRMDAGACLPCEDSGGLCWTGTESESQQPTCLCRGGALPLVCPKGRGLNLGRKIALAGTGAAAIVFLSVCIIIYCIRKSSSNTSLAFWVRKAKNDLKVEALIIQYGSWTPKRYRYSDVKKLTNSFKYELGKGGYGNVYKGKLADGRFVAVKVLNASKGNGQEFINEVASIGRTSHVNVVSLLGFCYEGENRALIYEFMPNGSLEKFIYRNIPLETGQRLGGKKLYEIALGIARGLEYLHRGCHTHILHLDIKPHNILLDEDFCPKISDFGLAKLYSRKESIVSMMEARGTIGYIAPEVFCRNFGAVSHKSDVYSYGMMVLEMVGGIKANENEEFHTSEIYFPHWIYNRIELVEDLQLQGQITIDESDIARKMIIVGLWCIQTDPSQRPSMNKVIDMLEGSIEALEIPPKPFLYACTLSAPNSSTTAACL